MSHTAKMVVWTETERQLGRCLPGSWHQQTIHRLADDTSLGVIETSKQAKWHEKLSASMLISLKSAAACDQKNTWMHPKRFLASQAARNASPVCMALLSEFCYYLLNSKQNPDSWLKPKQYYNLDEEFKNQDDGFMQHQHHLYHPTLITQWKTATS